MDTTDFFTATKRLLKAKLRISIAARGSIAGMADELKLFEEQLQSEWQEQVGKLGPVTTVVWDQLSQQVNQAFIEATREIRQTAGDGTMVTAGLADFQTSWRPDEFLPPRVQA